MTNPFLIFSGHNDRAVVSLCRFFDRAGLPFVIVAAGPGDAIHRTRWRGRVAYNRIDKIVDVAWLRQLAESLGSLRYCPTTEFINHLMLAHREPLAEAGWQLGLPDRDLYAVLTSKARSQALVMALCPQLHLPGAQPMAAPRAPCVLKPIDNVAAGRVLYPILCRTELELDAALAGLDREPYFAQDFIFGQSHYLCAYVARDGRLAWFWQINLMQQPGGKSIVLARPGRNPGLDEGRLLRGLHARGFHGPLMLEVIESAGRLFYIEVNPRFWGPLQLALDVCPAILELFARDMGADPRLPAAQTPRQPVYAWAFGAGEPGSVAYPAARALTPEQIQQMLQDHDVYAAADTRALHACH